MKLKYFFCVVLCIAPNFLFAQSVEFLRTLRVGMKGSDVRALQQILNIDRETRVAESGIGSRGNETDYFGPATMRALVRFQEKYRGEVLIPAGLTSGTGIFGALTRAKVVALKSISHTEATSTPAKGDVVVMFPSQYSGKPGTMITISGTGFTKTDNTIYFGDGHAVEKASSWNGQSITFKVPAIPKGNYKLYVKNVRGESNRDAFFVVTDGVTPEPKIESITPDKGGRGTTVTLTGKGFAPANNTVRTGTGVVDGLASTDGASLSFTLPTGSFDTAIKASIPVWLYVINENGVSNAIRFTMSF